MKFYTLYRDYDNDCWLKNTEFYQVYYCVTEERSRNKKLLKYLRPKNLPRPIYYFINTLYMLTGNIS